MSDRAVEVRCPKCGSDRVCCGIVREEWIPVSKMILTDDGQMYTEWSDGTVHDEVLDEYDHLWCRDCQHESGRKDGWVNV
jgi:hypothetical protein